MRRQLLFSMFFGLVLLSGCQETENLPPDEFVINEPRVVGDFYQEDKDTGRRTDVTIWRSDNTKLPYSIRWADEKETQRFQLYKIGDSLLSFAKTEGGYAVCKVTISRTQLIGEVMGKDFFLQNPDALPQTQIVKTEHGSTVTLRATPEQLAAFFKLHGSTAKLFVREQPLLLNRVPK